VTTCHVGAVPAAAVPTADLSALALSPLREFDRCAGSLTQARSRAAPDSPRPALQGRFAGQGAVPPWRPCSFSVQASGTCSASSRRLGAGGIQCGTQHGLLETDTGTEYRRDAPRAGARQARRARNRPRRPAGASCVPAALTARPGTRPAASTQTRRHRQVYPLRTNRPLPARRLRKCTHGNAPRSSSTGDLSSSPVT